MRFGNPACDRQPETCALRPGVQSSESLEDAITVLRWNTFAIVGNPNGEPV